MDYSEILCQAVDTIVTQRLSAISYDQTTICTIVDDSKREQGIYVVSNGSVKFEAYSDITTYRNKTNVYVTVPEGDWNQAKFIIGKKTNNEYESYNYRKPFDMLVDVTGNCVNKVVNEGLVANNTETTYIEVFNQSYASSHICGYTRLGLQAAFQSWLNSFYTTESNVNNEKISVPHRVVDGDYGLRVTLTTSNDTTAVAAASTGVYEILLSAKDMNGNPYDFKTYFQQEKVFDISEIGDVTNIKIEFYETPGTFVDEEGNLFPWQDFLGNSVAPNLFVRDVYLCFGYDVSAFGDNQVVLYAVDGRTTYSPAYTPQQNQKQLSARWIHNFGTNGYQTVKSSDDLDYEVRWYRYRLGAPSADEYSGVYWERISGIGLKEFDYTFAPDKTLRDERIKVIILYDNLVLRSNVLTFNNEKDVVSQATIDAMSAVGIVCLDDSYGNYRIYALGNSLIDSSDAAVIRTFQAWFNDSVLTDAERIEWIIPAENTMIEVDGAGTPSGGNYHIVRTGSAQSGIVNTQEYRIKSYYSQNYSNNTIECIVTKDGVNYFGSKELTFGVAGTSGTDCTFIIDFDNGATAVTASGSQATTVTARLYDYENKEVDLLSDTRVSISWTWKNSSDVPSFLTFQAAGTKFTQREIKYNASNVPTNNYAVLQATLTGWGDYPLTAYLPIPIRSSANYRYVEGPTSILYDALGYTSSFYQNPLKLWIGGSGALSEASVTWRINAKGTTSTGVDFYPKIKTSSNGNQFVQPPCVYVESSSDTACLYATSGSIVVWSQPLLMLQNRYPSKMVNDWDGSLQLGGDDGNSILSARLVAGKKNSDNSFSGVMLGTWKGKDNESSISQNTGVYGFYHGAASYGFRDDGTAFLGVGGKGRIEFDGTSGIIQSANYDNNDKAGMQINLSDGKINAHNFTLKAGNTDTGSLTITTTNSDNLKSKAIEVNGKEGNFYVCWDGSISATAANITGEINANSGKIAGWTIEKEQLSSPSDQIYLNSKDGTIHGATITGGKIYVPSEESHSFSVDSTGILNAEGATITGKITATSGKIAGWTINGDQLKSSSGDIYLDGSNGTIHGSTIEGGSISITGTKNSFSVGANGILTANGVDISGTITATDGAIGGWTIDNNTIYTNDSSTKQNGQIYANYYNIGGGQSGSLTSYGKLGSFAGATGEGQSTIVNGIYSNTRSIVLQTDGYDGPNNSVGNIRLKAGNNMYLKVNGAGNIVMDGDTLDLENINNVKFKSSATITGLNLVAKFG